MTEENKQNTADQPKPEWWTPAHDQKIVAVSLNDYWAIYKRYTDIKEKLEAHSKPCEWKQVDTEHMPDTWQADCGAMWTFTDGGPQDNDMNFCHNCGKELIEGKDE